MTLSDNGIISNNLVTKNSEPQEKLVPEFKTTLTDTSTDSVQTDASNIGSEDVYKVESNAVNVDTEVNPEKKINRKTILGFVIGGVVLLIAIIVLLVVLLFIIPSNNYAEGQVAFDEGDYVLAAEKFESAGDYGDSKERLEEIIPLLVADDQFEAALVASQKLPNEVKDSYVLYVQGAKDVSEGNTAEALDKFEQSKDLAVSREMFVNTSSTMAMTLCKSEEYKMARSLMATAAEIDKDNEEAVNKCAFITAYIYIAEGNTEKATQLLSLLPKDYSFEGISTFELLGTLAVVGEWNLVRYYISDYGTFSADELMEYGYPQDSILFLPNGKYVATTISGAYGSNGGTWQIDSTYSGPDEYGLVFDKDSPAESRGSLNGNTFTMYYASSSDIGTYQKA